MFITTPAETTTSTMKIKTINPATEEVLREYQITNEEQLNESIRRSRNAFAEWKKDIDKRADHLYYLLMN